MPTDEYVYSGGGALKLKGAKVKKHKKRKEKSSLESALASRESPAREGSSEKPRGGEDDQSRVLRKAKDDTKDQDTFARQDEAEEREEDTPSLKTEAEKRFEEARRKKLLQMNESGSARPELFKTHKQRVEELNTYLSKLSEHHDMPKIGPG